MTIDAEQVRAPRADAERNRRKILDAAASVFAERGVTATVNEVALAAGVRVGTVYRKFPDKEAVFDALFDVKIDNLVRLAVEASRVQEPGPAFRGFLLRGHRGACDRPRFGCCRHAHGSRQEVRHGAGSTACSDGRAADQSRPNGRGGP